MIPAKFYYIPAVDKPSVYLGRHQFDEMRARPNVSDTAKLMGLLPWYIGAEMVLIEPRLPPRYARGTACKCVGIDLHPDEPSIKGRDPLPRRVACSCATCRNASTCRWKAARRLPVKPPHPALFSLALRTCAARSPSRLQLEVGSLRPQAVTCKWPEHKCHFCRESNARFAGSKDKRQSVAS